MGKQYTLEDLSPYFNPPYMADQPLPNAEEIPIEEALSDLCSGAVGVQGMGHGVLPDGTGTRARFRLLTRHGQGGGFTGEGTVIVAAGWKKPHRAFRFTLCKHQFVSGPGGNPMRGWHPGYCKHCGLDMSVDSGD